MFKKSVLLVSVGACLGGCVTGQPLREIAIDNNRLAARTANEQTLLNILRAKDRMPAHHTSFTALRGNISLTTKAELGSTFPESATETTTAPLNQITKKVTSAVDSLTPGVSATLVSNPSFDLAVYDTQEFQNGITAPVSQKVIAYYLDQGWPEDFLTAMYVAKVKLETTPFKEFNVGKAVPGEFEILNDPLSIHDPKVTGTDTGTDTCKLCNFEYFLWRSKMSWESSSGSETKIGKLTDYRDNIEPEDIDGKKYEIKYVGDTPYVYRKKPGTPNISFDVTKAQYDVLRAVYGGAHSDMKSIKDDKICEFLLNKKTEYLKEKSPKQKINENIIYPNNSILEINTANSYPIVATINKINKGKGASATENAIAGENTSGAPDTEDFTVACGGTKVLGLKLTATPRSTDSMLYFLGSYARYELDPASKVYRIEGDKKLIDLEKGGVPGALLTVGYRGSSYSLPDPTTFENGTVEKPSHRGNQAIVFVQQLINLHKKADSLPAPSSLRIIP